MYRKPRKPKPKEFLQRKHDVRSREGYVMRHVLSTDDEKEMLRLNAFYTRQGRIFKILKNNGGWDIFVQK